MTNEGIEEREVWGPISVKFCSIGILVITLRLRYENDHRLCHTILNDIFSLLLNKKYYNAIYIIIDRRDMTSQALAKRGARQ